MHNLHHRKLERDAPHNKYHIYFHVWKDPPTTSTMFPLTSTMYCLSATPLSPACGNALYFWSESKLGITSRGTDKQDSGKGVAGYRIVRTDLKTVISSARNPLRDDAPLPIVVILLDRSIEFSTIPTQHCHKNHFRTLAQYQCDSKPPHTSDLIHYCHMTELTQWVLPMSLAVLAKLTFRSLRTNLSDTLTLLGTLANCFSDLWSL